MNIRKAEMADLELLMEKYEKARAFMVEHGNPEQWGTSYPPRELVVRDIQNGDCYVCEAEGRIVGVFYYKEGTDPTYQVITEGKWNAEGPYGVVHRITSDGSVKGTATFCLEWAFEQCGNLRIDTHRENRVMQKLLKKSGFEYCGKIRTEADSERLAYQKVR
jgi:RimJ/RimL family protein N-acetyltransferase